MADALTVSQLEELAKFAYEQGDIGKARQRLAQADALKMKQAQERGELKEFGYAGGAGALRGAGETIDFGGNLAQKVLDMPLAITKKLQLLDLISPTVKEATGIDLGTSEDIVIPKEEDATTLRGTLADVTGGYSEYESPLRFGRLGGTMGEFTGGAAVMPLGGPFRSITSAIPPAIGSEIAGQLTEGTEYENLARFAGALGVPIAQAGATPLLRRTAIGDPTEVASYLRGSERPQSVEYLKSKGIKDISAGQQIGSSRLMSLEGSQGPSLKARQELTQAILRETGTIADLATPNVMNQTRNRIGKVFDMVDNAAGGAPTQAEANAMLAALSKAEGDISIGTVPKKLEKIVLDFSQAAIDNAAISSKNISKIRTDLNNSMKKYAADNDMISYELAYDLKEALDDMVQRQIPKELIPSLSNARNQYRSYLTLERGMFRAGTDAAGGLLTPEALASATRRREGTSYTKGTGTDVANIARASQEVLSSLPAVKAGGVRDVGLPFQKFSDVIPSMYASRAQQTLPLNLRQAVFPSLFERITRQTGGLLSID